MTFYIQTPGISTANMSQLTLALEYIKQSPTFNFFYPNMNGMTLHVGSNVTNMEFPNTGEIGWNPTLGMQVISDTGILGVQSPAMALVHEVAHAVFGHNETQATAFETLVARELGEPTRANYYSTGADVRVLNSTQHTDNGTWKTFEKGGGSRAYGLFDGSSNAPNMGTGYPPAPPNAPPGWNPFAASYYSMDSKGDLRDASYLEFPPYNQKSVPNNVDTKILELYLVQEDSAPVSALAIEHTDEHHVVTQIVGVPESAHYA